jgi:hypothetical protein
MSAQDLQQRPGAVAGAANAKFTVFMTDGSKAIDSSEFPFSAKANCQLLEKGGIIYFPQTPFFTSEDDKQFLLQQKQLEADYHKNVAYRPLEDRVTGVKKESGTDVDRLRGILKSYSDQVTTFMGSFLSPYTPHLHKDFASFRPIEEKGRKLRLRARNDLLHVDSFATRPIFGNRIFRVFTNVNPTTERVWRTSETFDVLLNQFKDVVAAPKSPSGFDLAQIPLLKTIAKELGFKLNSPSAYDSWMLNFHNFLKENAKFQANTRKDVWSFPSNSAWMVFTDMVSHSVLSGQYALEQTYIVSKEDLTLPEKAPINLLKATYKTTALG